MEEINVFYMFNGQILFAEYIGIDSNTDEYIIKNPVAIQVGQGKQIGMQTAYPFTNFDTDIRLNWRHVTTTMNMSWNKQLIDEYNKFWERVRAQSSGIILPGNGSIATPGPRPIKPV